SASDGDAQPRIPLLSGLDVSLFQPDHLQIAAVDATYVGLLVCLPLLVERAQQHLIQRQGRDCLRREAEERNAEIAAFDGRRPVVQIHRALAGLYQPAIRVIEPDQAAVQDADGISRFALPGVVVFEFQSLHAHVLILAWLLWGRLP